MRVTIIPFVGPHISYSKEVMPKRNKTGGFVVIIRFERSSVCMGDDCMAPNPAKLNISDTASFKDLIYKIKQINYLPNVYGGKATWILYHGTKPMVVVAQQWEEAKYLINQDTKLFELFHNAESTDLEFVYRSQNEPDEVLNINSN
ncbi:hypothetical protein RE628_20325 [Paenibacillus sp. D2_2]|uniref:hypothetical protein n=1 Tax=Paenibacillus sp. D2_2 TaxID=3073092 RepID=UPI0028155696|nr:hypothetical protein [Paenibacillus sp. D2_2]WMT39720.1 hypothetical protein RE628_20325 [Paenibacillus sp. D2_2]